jgi:hypothetical protein
VQIFHAYHQQDRQVPLAQYSGRYGCEQVRWRDIQAKRLKIKKEQPTKRLIWQAL